MTHKRVGQQPKKCVLCGNPILPETIEYYGDLGRCETCIEAEDKLGTGPRNEYGP